MDMIRSFGSENITRKGAESGWFLRLSSSLSGFARVVRTDLIRGFRGMKSHAGHIPDYFS